MIYFYLPLEQFNDNENKQIKQKHSEKKNTNSAFKKKSKKIE
jgi:hypothetical protein